MDCHSEILCHGANQTEKNCGGTFLNQFIWQLQSRRSSALAYIPQIKSSMVGIGIISIFSLVCQLVNYYLIYRACAICHFCQNNCFFILLSWLPTYFHDNFPQAQSWIFNVVPWLLMVPGVAAAGWLSNKLSLKGFNVGQQRKICESLCGCTEAFCLICIGKKEHYLHI